MKHYPSWISLIGYCVLMVLAAALAFAVIVAGGSVALAGHQKLEENQATVPASPKAPSGEAFEGMVTDSRCGARHFRTSHLSSAQCARMCVRAGASYVLIDGEHRYTLVGGDEALNRFVGERAKVSGTRQGSTILVTSAASLF